jgi:tetratricopeptide (TPR) repeat protein
MGKTTGFGGVVAEAMEGQEIGAEVSGPGLVSRKRIRDFVAALALAFVPVSVLAPQAGLTQPVPSNEELAHALCDSPDTTPEQTIAGCSALIKSGAVKGTDLADTYNNRADGYLAKKNYDLAIADENKAISLDPGNANALNNRCLAYVGKKQSEKAITDCSQAIKLNPGFAHYYRNRAAAYLQKGRRQEALADIRAALNYDPKDKVAMDMLVTFAAKMDQGGAHVVDAKHPAPASLAARVQGADEPAPAAKPAAKSKAKSSN